MTERHSGAKAAALSAILPGLGQWYLGQRRLAVVFAAPVIALLVFIGLVLTNPESFAKAAAPNISFALMLMIIGFGIWWMAAVLHAWRGGLHEGFASVAVVAVLILVIGVGDAFAAVYMWRIRVAVGVITTSDPFDATFAPATPSPSPTPPGVTPNPEVTRTPRPPDYEPPEDAEPSDDPEPTIIPGPTPGYDIETIDAHADGLLNVMLVGLDWKPGRDSKRTDTILVLSINSDSGEVMMFSFPRDTQRLPLYNGGTFNGKINTFARFANQRPEDYPDGGMQALKNEVGYILGIPIDYFASVNMPGFIEVVRQVGSVTVNNTRDIRDDQLEFYLSPGVHTLGPDDALRYVRSRHGSGGDFGRNERQQQVLTALRKEMLKPQNLAKLPDIVEALSQVITTDFPPDQIDQLLALSDTVEEEPSQTWIFKSPEWAKHLPGNKTGGRPLTYPLMDKIAALSIELFGDKSLWNGEAVPPDPTFDLAQ